MSEKTLDIEFRPITSAKIEQLRCLNLVVFPVHYSDQFYIDVLQKENDNITKLVYHSDQLVGSVCCRYEKDTDNLDKRRVYIMTFGVLAPYRGYGIGSRMINYIIDVLSKAKDISYIYLHVQTSNDEAIKFYTLHQFQVIETLYDYYRKIEPPNAYHLKRNIYDLNIEKRL